MNRVVILSLAKLTDDSEGDCVLPFRVKNQRGAVIDQGVLSTRRARAVTIPDDADLARVPCVFVELTGRSGIAITHRIALIGRFTNHTIELVPDDLPRWLAWAAADTDLTPSARTCFENSSAYCVSGRIWVRRLSTWHATKLVIEDEKCTDYAKQFELTTREPSILEIGGPELAPRFIALPPGRVKVLLRPESAREDPLSVLVVRSDSPERNTLLSLLSLHQAAHSEDVTKELGSGFDWGGVGEDWLSGCALGYVAVRRGAFDLFSRADAECLLEMARGAPDAAILLATHAIAEGKADASWVLRLMDVGIERGLPVLAQSLSAANAALDVLRRSPKAISQKKLAALTEKVRTYDRAKSTAGPFLSFYGSAPYAPGLPKRIEARKAFGFISTTAVSSALVSSFRSAPYTEFINTRKDGALPQTSQMDIVK